MHMSRAATDEDLQELFNFDRLNWVITWNETSVSLQAERLASYHGVINRPVVD